MAILCIRFLFVIWGFFSLATYAADYQKNSADLEIESLYRTLLKHPIDTVPQRIDWFSQQFLNRPYELDALGEGDTGKYDQMPLYRTDAFDCQTFVETVMALAFSSNLESFKTCLNNIRYQGGIVDFMTRNHFTSLDWNPNNRDAGLIQDITPTLAKGQPKVAHALIDKKRWYDRLTTQNIRLKDFSLKQQQKRLQLLQKKATIYEPIVAKITYLSFDQLFLKNGLPNFQILKHIPNGALLEVVRPNWDMRQKIGTYLNVSHMGFIIRTNNKLLFRQASSTARKVVDTPLVEYLNTIRKSPSIRGIHIEVFRL